MTPGDLQDEQLRLLMRSAQSGDGEAYRALLTLVTPRIRRVVRARRTFLSSADVEDIVQDVLLSMHSVRASYDPNRPFLPWMVAIVRNRLADAARRYARQQRREVVVEALDVTFADLTANTEDEGAGDREALTRAIQDLPPSQRQAIELLKLQEMSLKEASVATGTSVSALKVATHRAMASLKRMLGAAGTDEH
ncbi:MAG: sigma-70 family RNA polymerase sigma factor [Vicinamibacterales bacterium]